MRCILMCLNLRHTSRQCCIVWLRRCLKRSRLSQDLGRRCIINKIRRRCRSNTLRRWCSRLLHRCSII
uniref:Uncharacterized protein n=1 Tax=Arundo donax TaxID=35708 RepID=A0A0A9G9K2_ARUDO